MKQTENQDKATDKVVEFGVFTGIYRNDQQKLYHWSQVYLGLSPEQSHRLSENLASDIGRLVRGTANAAASFGSKPNKDNVITWAVKNSGKTGVTFPLSLYCLCRDWEKLSSWGLHLTDSKIALRDNWKQYINEMLK